ncbi:hypothetical protein ACIQI8_42360 [Streptomyces sp. NPDC092369]
MDGEKFAARARAFCVAARAYFADHWTLCAPWDAMALDRSVGQ